MFKAFFIFLLATAAFGQDYYYNKGQGVLKNLELFEVQNLVDSVTFSSGVLHEHSLGTLSTIPSVNGYVPTAMKTYFYKVRVAGIEVSVFEAQPYSTGHGWIAACGSNTNAVDQGLWKFSFVCDSGGFCQTSRVETVPSDLEVRFRTIGTPYRLTVQPSHVDTDEVCVKLDTTGVNFVYETWVGAPPPP